MKEIFGKEFKRNNFIETKKSEGWFFIGRKSLTQTKFFSDSARFLEVPYQTQENIKEKYLEMVRIENPTAEFDPRSIKIESVLDESLNKLEKLRKISTEEEYRDTLKNLREEDKTYLVFIRKVKK